MTSNSRPKKLRTLITSSVLKLHDCPSKTSSPWTVFDGDEQVGEFFGEHREEYIRMFLAAPAMYRAICLALSDNATRGILTDAIDLSISQSRPIGRTELVDPDTLEMDDSIIEFEADDR